jgi:hypothetical protein
MNQLVAITADRAPALVAASGEHASYRFFEFFTANIRNIRAAPTRARRWNSSTGFKRVA